MVRPKTERAGTALPGSGTTEYPKSCQIPNSMGLNWRTPGPNGVAAFIVLKLAPVFQESARLNQGSQQVIEIVGTDPEGICPA